MNIRFPTENITDVSFVVQWDAVTNHPGGSYNVTWTNGSNMHAAIVNKTSYTITGLTPKTIDTVTVTAVNKCGRGPTSTVTNLTINIPDSISPTATDTTTTTATDTDTTTATATDTDTTTADTDTTTATNTATNTETATDTDTATASVPITTGKFCKDKDSVQNLIILMIKHVHTYICIV